MQNESPIHRAIKAAGGVSALAHAVSVRPPAVYKWFHRVPAERCIAIEKATGVSRHDLRPDIYPLETDQVIECQEQVA